ncbi:hypothetical protein [Priestia taiwanensis]|uniref:Lipoprotein n=1 Tax=Priestia taiwanensis TaxID=1347902 RepID=A0A917EPS8_9BACI|nr:hypothetical protein [Priestia taiwanensis]MBM7363903.1 hypothetical protein [Priestia taiwanensis]GGE69970.1 hypothetical protein GCM10007140_19960 [Priestia taiwanensis]
MRISLLLVSLCIFLLTGCLNEKENTPKDETATKTEEKNKPTSGSTNKEQTKKEPSIQKPSDKKSETLYTTYKDKTYPFELKFPADLGKIKATHTKLDDDTVQFHIPIEGQESLIFSVVAVPSEKVASYKDSQSYTFVGKNNTHHFFIIQADEAPDTFYQAKNEKKLEQWKRVMEKDVPIIMKSFKLLS